MCNITLPNHATKGQINVPQVWFVEIWLVYPSLTDWWYNCNWHVLCIICISTATVCQYIILRNMKTSTYMQSNIIDSILIRGSAKFSKEWVHRTCWEKGWVPFFQSLFGLFEYRRPSIVVQDIDKIWAELSIWFFIIWK